MAHSIDTFQLYIESLDSSSTSAPKKPVRTSVPEPDDSFDTSYVDKVIFGGGGGGQPADPDPEEVKKEATFELDQGFTSSFTKSDEVIEIDSGLSSPENVGSFKRPDFLKLNSFMIWNDPDQLKSPDYQTSQIQEQQQQNPLGSPDSELSSSADSQPPTGQSPEPESAPSTATATAFANPAVAISPSNSMNMKTMKKRGLFSRSTAGGLASGGDLEVTIGGDKSPKSPTTSSSSHLNNSSGGGNNIGSGGIGSEQDEDRFNGDGVQFHGKLIGSEYVAEARGEQMCQQSLKKLKIIQKAMGGHKRRIHLYISFDGIKIQDALTSEQLFHHTVPQISFISRDETDTRAFGYVFGNSTTGHQFIGIKTKKEAMVVMTTIGQLFAITLKRKRSAEEAAALAAAAIASSSDLTSGGGVGGLVDTATDDDHMYHSVYDIESSNTLGRPVARGSRTTSQNSENVIIPALPPPSSDHHRRGHLPLPGQQQQQQTVKLAPPGPTTMFGEMDMFGGGFDPHSAPIGGVTNHVDKNAKLSASSYDWANFDDDANNLSTSAAAANVNSTSMIDDSTLNTISSISDMNVNASALSTSKTLSQNESTNSATLVARYNQKNHPKNSSSSTIASTNFDGADPFSDAFGSDDPFSGSLAVGGGDMSSASLGAAGSFKQHDPNSTLANQFGGLNLEHSTNSYKSNLDLNNSFSKQSGDPLQSSSDRYAALADIHNLSNSIFDSFGNKKSDYVRKGSNDQRGGGKLFASSQSATVAIPRPTTAQSNLFASGSFNQGSAFHPATTASSTGHNVAMFGQPPNAPILYHSAVPGVTIPPGVYAQGSHSASPVMMVSGGTVSMMPPVATTSQMLYNQVTMAATAAMPMPGQNSLAHSAQWSGASTSSLPTAFSIADQQSQFMSSNSPRASGFVPSNPMIAGGGGGGGMVAPNGMHFQRNQMQASSASLFSTPTIAAQSFSSSSNASNAMNASNNSLNRSNGDLQVFQELDPLGKNKASFPLKQQDLMYQQQQSMDSFTRNCSTPSSVHQYPRQRSPLPGQYSLPSSSVGTSSPEPAPSPLAVMGLTTSTTLPDESSTTQGVPSSQPQQQQSASVSHQSSFTSQWSVSSSIPPSSAYVRVDPEFQVVVTSSQFSQSAQSSEPNDQTTKRTIISRQQPEEPTVTNCSMMATLNTNTYTTTSTTSSISSSSVSSSLQNVSSEMQRKENNTVATAATSSKFETTFDDVFEAEGGSRAVGSAPKHDSSEQILLPLEEDEDKEAEGDKEEEKEEQQSKLQLKASITSYDSIVSESIKSSDLNPVATRRSTLSRQSSTSSSTRDRGSGTPPAIPPRTDLPTQHSSNPGSAHKYRFQGSSSSSTPPPPLPPPNKATPSASSSSVASYSSQYSSPYYPPPYGSYGPYGGPPPPEMYATAEPRRYRYPPPPPPPNPWAHPSSSHYEYLYTHPPPPDHHPPYYSARGMDPNYPPPHAYAPPPPPPPHPAYDPYYRQSPYSPATLYQSSPYSSSPAPPPSVPATSEGGYSNEYLHYHHPPPPVPTSHFAHLNYPKKGNSSNASTSPPPPPLDGSTPPPSSMAPPLLPNPQRRISSSSMVERYSSCTPGSYFATLGRSNSSASALASEQQPPPARPPPSSSNPGIPNYPPPPPPVSSHHTAAPPPSYYGHPYYGQPQEAANPYDYTSTGGDPNYEHFYDVPRRKEAEYQQMATMATGNRITNNPFM